MSPQNDKHTRYRPLPELLDHDWTENIVIANGVAQHYFRNSNGRHRRPAVVLLHGFMESGATWLRVARALATNYDVVMPDARAHGRSVGPENGFTPELLAEDAAALIEVLGLERPFLIGRSNGAVTAVLVAAAHPDQVRGLVLEEPPVGGMPRPAIRPEQVQQQNWFQTWLQWMQNLKQMSHGEQMASAAARWPHGLPVPPDEPLWPEDDFVSYVDALARFHTAVFQQKIGYWSLVPYLTQAAALDRPVLLLAGNPKLGSLLPEETAVGLATAWAQGKIMRVAEAGHIISRGRTYDQFMQQLQPFLTQHQTD